MGDDRQERQSVRSRLLSDVAFRFIAQGVGALKGLVFLPLIARSFGEAAYGVWSQIALSVVLVQPLLTLRLGNALTRYLAGIEPGKPRRKAVWTVNWTVWSICAATALVMLIWRSALSVGMFGSRESEALIVPFVALLVGHALLSMGIAYFRAVGQLKTSTLFQAATSLGSTLVVGVVVLGFGGSLQQAAIAWAASIGCGAMLVQLGIVSREGVGFAIRRDTLRRFLRYSLPLVPAVVAIWIIEYSDRFLIVHMLGLREAGIYSGSYRLAQVMRMLMAPMVFVLLPTVLRLENRGDKQLRRRLMREAQAAYLFVGCGAAAFLIGLGPELMAILGSAGFDISQGLLAFLVLGEALLALRLLYTQSLYLSERTLEVMLIVGGTAFINVVANLLLIPSLGILGAALATFAAYAVQWLAMLRFVADRASLAMPVHVLLRVFAGAGAAYVVLHLTRARGTALSIGGVVLAGLVYVAALASSASIRRMIRHMLVERRQA